MCPINDQTTLVNHIVISFSTTDIFFFYNIHFRERNFNPHQGGKLEMVFFFFFQGGLKCLGWHGSWIGHIIFVLLKPVHDSCAWECHPPWRDFSRQDANVTSKDKGDPSHSFGPWLAALTSSEQGERCQKRLLPPLTEFVPPHCEAYGIYSFP